MSDVTDFMRENRPSGKISKLDPYRSEIEELKQNDYSEKDILRFLAEKKGIVVTQPTLNRFIKTRIRGEKTATKKAAYKMQDVNKQAVTTTKPEVEVDTQHSEAGTQTFDWQTPIPRENLV
jgi:hypothetical protein